MRNGHGSKSEKMIIIEPDEFNEVVKRVHGLLVKRAESAHERAEEHPSPRAERRDDEASKDAAAFVHMIHLIEQMTGEIEGLREVLEGIKNGEVESITSDDAPEQPWGPEMFSGKRTRFLN